MKEELGLLKGEMCNREGCKGIIEEGEKEGCCSCHINPPCSYCTTQTEYCPECGWSAEEGQREYDKAQAEYYLKNPPKPIVYKSELQLFNELKDGEFGYIRVASGAHTVTRLKGKHPNMSRNDIYKKLGLAECPDMPRMKSYNGSMFELTYFND